MPSVAELFLRENRGRKGWLGGKQKLALGHARVASRPVRTMRGARPRPDGSTVRAAERS